MRRLAGLMLTDSALACRRSPRAGAWLVQNHGSCHQRATLNRAATYHGPIGRQRLWQFARWVKERSLAPTRSPVSQCLGSRSRCCGRFSWQDGICDLRSLSGHRMKVGTDPIDFDLR